MLGPGTREGRYLCQVEVTTVDAARRADHRDEVRPAAAEVGVGKVAHLEAVQVGEAAEVREVAVDAATATNR
jgi:hypothetical protein